MQQNLCIRCGKERIDGKVWTEMVGQTLVTHTQTICPDPACQKIVDEELSARRVEKELLADRRRNKAKEFASRFSQGKRAQN